MMLSADATDDLSVHSFHSRGDQSKTSTTYGSSAGTRTDAEQLKLLRKDSWIQSLRFLSLCILLVVAYVVAMTVYVSLKAAEYREFENQFESQSEQIGEGLQAELAIKLKALESLSVTVTAYVESQPDAAWPNVTLPKFAYRSASTLTIGGGISVGLQPIVRKEQRKGWEDYAVQNQDWRQESIAFQEKHKDPFDSHLQNRSSVEETSISDRVFKVIDGVPSAVEEALVIPVWQYSPVDPSLSYINYDQHGMQRNREALEEVVDKGAPVVGMFFELAQSFHG